MGLCQIPVCFFRSRAIFIDDSQDFLINFSLQLPEDFNFQLYASPDSASMALAHIEHIKALHNRCLSQRIETFGSPLTTQGININIAAIHNGIYDPKRFAEISVVVIDYAMPGMNGLEFCQHIKDLPLGKILLTGKADERIAIQAFNDGLIDCFAQKSDPDLANIIKTNINSLQKRYFQTVSDSMVHILSINGLFCLQDSGFAKVFDKIIEENNIVEYYLIDNTGSFLLLDKDANPSFLLIKTDEDIRYYHEMAIDNQAPSGIVQQLSEGNCIPNCLLFDGLYNQNFDWSQPLFPATKYSGLQDYYYALVKEPIGFDLQTGNITSYQQFLENLTT